MNRQLIIVRRRRQMRRLLLLRILTIAFIITMTQIILFYIISRELVYFDSNFDRKYILKLINNEDDFNSRIFKTL